MSNPHNQQSVNSTKKTSSHGSTPPTTSGIAENSGIGAPITTGVTVSPEVWAQMQTLLALLPIQQTAPPSWYSAAQSGAQNQNLITSDQSLGTFLSKPGFDYDRGEESTPASGQEKESPDAKADRPNKSSPDPVNQFLENNPASGLREDISTDSQADKPNKSGSDHPVTQAVVVKDPQDTMNTCDFNSFDFKRGALCFSDPAPTSTSLDLFASKAT
ncbi:hypothetical protein PtB15_11B515 [Puccinia triticina]|nr:hypothetical protein PtB15_11B515 [Puccinia triticina]